MPTKTIAKGSAKTSAPQAPTAPVEPMWIGGHGVRSDETIAVINPATEEVIAHVCVATIAQVHQALESAKLAFGEWSRTTAMERGRLLRKWARRMEEDRPRLAELICMEQGKSMELALAEVDAGLGWLEYYAGFDRRIEGEILPADRPDEQMWIVRAPIGVVACITPWNFPFAIAIRKLAPALIAGNTVVLKPHEETPLSTLELFKAGIEIGIPPGVINVVNGPGATVGHAIVDSPIPRFISFTGSAATGKAIRSAANPYLTTVSLELGGKQPFIVMEDADLDKAVEAAIFSRFINCGQACVSSERAYVHRNIWDEFLEKLVAATEKVKVGHPTDPGVFVGPKINLRELERLEKKVQDAVKAGAKVLTGGSRLKEGRFAKGFWYKPTILSNVSQDSPIMQEEIFGPVLPVHPFNDLDDAIRLANDSQFGLSACIFTRDVSRVMRAVNELECGEIYINRPSGESLHGYHNGWKQSGIAGDDGKHGLDHFMRKKVVYLRC